jgi:2,3-bisphosphoglycerate-independent phosphoglycerate mutase
LQQRISSPRSRFVNQLDLVRELAEKADTKIVMLVADGLGGLPLEPGGKTELETAATPNLDRLAARGTSGSSIPVLPGITPGSGPGHLGLFGYDPLEFKIGRGALEATGIGFELGPQDVAARGNFCTLDSAGLIADRRAGRIASEDSFRVVERLQAVRIPGVETFVKPVKEHRFVVVFRGQGLDGAVADTDPQAVGVAPLAPQPLSPAAGRTAGVATEFVRQAREILASEPKANGLVLRGFAAKPALPSYEDLYGLRAAASRSRSMSRSMNWLGTGTTTTFSSSTSSTPIPPAKTAISPRRCDGSRSSIGPCRGSRSSGPTSSW